MRKLAVYKASPTDIKIGSHFDTCYCDKMFSFLNLFKPEDIEEAEKLYRRSN